MAQGLLKGVTKSPLVTGDGSKGFAISVGRHARSVAAVLIWLASAPVAWAEAKVPTWPDGDLLAGTVERAVPRREADRAAIDRVGDGKFIASPWTPVVLGEPEALIDRVLKEAFERAHRRILSADLHLDEGLRTPTLADLDSGWDILAAADIGDRNRRLRMIADLAPDRDSLDVWGGYDIQAAVDAPGGPAMGGGTGTDVAVVRFFKDTMNSFKTGTFFTRERIGLALGVLLTIGVFSHIRASRH